MFDGFMGLIICQLHYNNRLACGQTQRLVELLFFLIAQSASVRYISIDMSDILYPYIDC